MRGFGLDDFAVHRSDCGVLLEQILLLLCRVEFDDNLALPDRLAGFRNPDDARLGNLRSGDDHRVDAFDLAARADGDYEFGHPHSRYSGTSTFVSWVA